MGGKEPAVPVEFLGTAATNDGSEISARSGASFDKEYTLRLARAHEETGWDRVLFAYGSGSPDPNVAQAILDYIDLGVDIISMRGYELLTDAIDIGQQVIPIVREEVAKRDRAALDQAGAGAGRPAV
jgi:alkanesulfonate monooxygenase SsuD/methylene tetrahydromethanopterin reductase-like flavin-dependent oxidoreductase (luciferase family)